ncbi:ssk1 response regulator receiver [Lobosporangium transversale]|uniref:Response regulatory domain-containing protein n=1 Tax=Lobosporangium transversale TaxID=64571 RepID=A0A1Y2GZM8_9FUNG|nr:hypothetical protein BCR41DRAFT_367312 [Lobosporangium transversale]KAF9918990.1 ssk1 response regulator receiver [Lobosporangium transversale]ORZ27726.1 hypothetical protein BCR41DRAFT_367312 [Lobosporangium transversale]|eukprot:XP_021885429.1 hypothetical protein BCR41DRAFT_367312 [Lobosporangium transversale]
MVQQQPAVPDSTSILPEKSSNHEAISITKNSLDGDSGTTKHITSTGVKKDVNVNNVSTPLDFINKSSSSQEEKDAIMPTQRTTHKKGSGDRSRPARLIRNLHASYFNQHASEQPSHNPTLSTTTKVVQSMRSNVFAFGAIASVAGCAVLLGQSQLGHKWNGFGTIGLIVQVTYHGIFATTCSWQWFKRMAFNSSNSVGQDKSDCKEGTDCTSDSAFHPSGATASEPSHIVGSSMTSDNEDTCSESAHATSYTKTVKESSSLSYWILGFGLLGLLGFTPAATIYAWKSYIWSPVLVLASLSPLVIGPILIGLDKIANAASEDETNHAAEIDNLQMRHEDLMEVYRNDNILKKNMLLETVGKEVQDAATLAIETLRQMTPKSLFPPSVSREQLSPCTLPIPITSILGLFTTMRHLQYIARNMQRLSRVMFTEYVQGIVERTSPHYHRGENKFDVGEFVQSLGDLVSADASLKGVEFVIYHSQYGLNHASIKGSEESWRHALINLIKSIVDCAKAGSTVELCLSVYAVGTPTQEENRVMVSFEIMYYPNPDSKLMEDDLAQLNTLLASKLVRAMGGSLEIEQLEGFVKRFVVQIEVELSSISHEEKTCNIKQSDGQQRPVHPLESKVDEAAQVAATKDNAQEPEKARANPAHESQQFYQQHIRTPLVSPSPPPSSPPPKRTGVESSQKVSGEPTVPELVQFSQKLSGFKVVLIAREHSAFAVRLTGYLKSWGINVVKRAIRDCNGAHNEFDSSDVVVSEEPQTPLGGKRTNSSMSLSGKSGLSGKAESQSAKSFNPAFIMIDDDINALKQQIIKMQSTPPSPAPIAGASKRPTHRRHKSITSVQQTSVIYFTSLPTFKQARDTIMFILGTHSSTIHYSIANTLAGSTLQGPLGPLPYILVLPKPAGPRRVLTAIHTAINVPVLDQSYSPIATAPTSPAPALHRFSEEINPLDRDQIIYDPVLNQAFARVPHSTQSSPGGLSPNNSLNRENRHRDDLVRQLIDAGGSNGPVTNPFDHTTASMMSPETPGSLQSVGSPTGILIPGNGNKPAVIQFDPTAKPSGTLSPSLIGTGLRRVSTSITRTPNQLAMNNEGGTVVIPSATSTGNHQPFSFIHSQRGTETGTPSGFIRLGNGQMMRPNIGRSPLSTPPAITQANGLLFSPPAVRHSSMASPLPQRPEPATMRNSSSGSGSLSSSGMDSPRLPHPVLPHGAIPSPSPLPTSPGALPRASPGTSGIISSHAASPPPSDAVAVRPRGPLSAKKTKDAKPSKSAPSLIQSGVVERVSPLVNVLIVEDNDINQRILVKFMQQRKIKYDLANNGLEAVEKWRVGGFHLVLMDIQMPVMDGIEATREIRRLEKAQKIGVFPTDKPNSVGNSMQATLSASSAASSSSASSPPASPFRSPVIIVALTASAESEDLRKTALLAGCNDYITKPVVLPWLERKIVDWGCMQALIDVDAWKEWKRGLEGTSPGAPSTGPTGGPTPALKKSLANAASVTRANLKRPSISSRSIKNSKAAAAAAAKLASTAVKKEETNTQSNGVVAGEFDKAPGSKSAIDEADLKGGKDPIVKEPLMTSNNAAESSVATSEPKQP